LFEDSIRAEQVVVFLDHLQRCVPGKMLIVWDRLSAHRGKLVRDYVDLLQGRIEVEYLPPYAPELNPVEYIWAYLKHHELPNVCAKDLWNLGEGARRSLRRMRRRKTLVTAFWKQASLWE
jgi:transposase